MDMEHARATEESLRNELDKRTEGMRKTLGGLNEDKAAVQEEIATLLLKLEALRSEERRLDDEIHVRHRWPGVAMTAHTRI
jgi:hypothetical protein